MISTCFNGLDVLHDKFGEIELRAPAVGTKMWCLFFCHAPSPGRCAFDGCIVLLTSIVPLCVTVYEPILMQFLPFFPEDIGLSDALHDSYFRRYKMAPQD